MDSDKAYTVQGYGGVAWAYCGDETAPDADTEWTGIEEPTGRVLMCMVGDDRVTGFDPDDVVEIAEEDYCHSCGQVGCTADGYDRESGNITYTVAIMLLVVLPCLVFVTHALNTLGGALR